MADGNQHFDCLIIGSGVCGIDTAYHVQKYSPWANYAVLERMADVGGTWEFFKYPGKRKDIQTHLSTLWSNGLMKFF